MKDGRTHLAHKAEHAVDLETGAVVGVTIQGADTGDTTTMVETVIAAAEQVEAVLPTEPGMAGRGWQPRAASASSDRSRSPFVSIARPSTRGRGTSTSSGMVSRGR